MAKQTSHSEFAQRHGDTLASINATYADEKAACAARRAKAEVVHMRDKEAAEAAHVAEREARIVAIQHAAHDTLTPLCKAFTQDATRRAVVALAKAWQQLNADSLHATGRGLTEWPLVWVFADLQIAANPACLELWVRPNMYLHELTNYSAKAAYALYRVLATGCTDGGALLPLLLKLESTVAVASTSGWHSYGLPANAQRLWDVARFGGSFDARVAAFKALDGAH